MPRDFSRATSSVDALIASLDWSCQAGGIRFRVVIAALFLAAFAYSHAPPTLIPKPPLKVRGNQLIDAANSIFLLRGVNLSETSLEAGVLTPFMFRVIQQRWNMNAVRLPITPAAWRSEGVAYFDRIAAVVAAANREGLIAILSAKQDSGLSAFWTACASYFKDNPRLIFALINEPSANRSAGWQAWHDIMQPLADAIRATGAAQLISAPSFHDALDFQGFGPEFYVRDSNLIYEAHPYFDHAVNDAARNANFGFLSAQFPVYAGAWGIPFAQTGTSCTAVPQDQQKATDLVIQSLAYFDFRSISWSVAEFSPDDLIRDYADYTPTAVPPAWTCGVAGSGAGIGQFVLLWMTGDPNGFGSIDPTQIASAAGGPVAPIAPGEIISFYGQSIGPQIPAGGRIDASGRVSTLLEETQVLFDGVAAPILFASYFQTNVQVPYEVAGQKTVSVKLSYRGIPSNVAKLQVVDAAPGLLTLLGTNFAAALNEDATLNSSSNPVSRGSIVTFFSTGAGVLSPAVPTGAPAQPPLAVPAQAATVTLNGSKAEILSATAAPGLVGAIQLNVRVPQDMPVESTPERATVVLTIGDMPSRFGVTFWAK